MSRAHFHVSFVTDVRSGADEPMQAIVDAEGSLVARVPASKAAQIMELMEGDTIRAAKLTPEQLRHRALQCLLSYGVACRAAAWAVGLLAARATAADIVECWAVSNRIIGEIRDAPEGSLESEHGHLLARKE